MIFLLAAILSLNILDLPLSDEKTEVYHHQRVEVKGFLHVKEGQWILSPEGSLMSCCIGAEGKAMRQILVLGNVNGLTAGSVVSLKGLLKKENIDNFSYVLFLD